jgi:Holliday junction resolvase
VANKNKNKGTYHEKWFVDWLKSIGVACKRVPLSGALGGEWSGDIHLTLDGQRWLVGEVKYRDKSNFPSPFTVLEGRDIAFYKRKTGKPQTLVIMSGEEFAKIIQEKSWGQVEC